MSAFSLRLSPSWKRCGEPPKGKDSTRYRCERSTRKSNEPAESSATKNDLGGSRHECRRVRPATYERNTRASLRFGPGPPLSLFRFGESCFGIPSGFVAAAIWIFREGRR